MYNTHFTAFSFLCGCLFIDFYSPPKKETARKQMKGYSLIAAVDHIQKNLITHTHTPPQTPIIVPKC